MQIKPFIAERFTRPTVQRQTTYKQADSKTDERLKGFSGIKMRIGRAKQSKQDLAKRLLKTNVYARREKKPSLLGLCRAAAKGLYKTNREEIII